MVVSVLNSKTNRYVVQSGVGQLGHMETYIMSPVGHRK